MYKGSLRINDILLLAVNLVPLGGVWFARWNASEIFMVYCLESLVLGLYNLIKMGLVTSIKKRDIWNDSGKHVTWMPGIFFMFFFLLHYGFFVAIQLSIFLAVSGIQAARGIHNTFDFVIHFPRYLSGYSQWLLLGFVISYGFIMLKDFILNGNYKTASLGATMYEPYVRVFIQQFTVIAGSLFLGFGADKIFIGIFVCVKIFFDVFVDYSKIISEIAKNQKLADRSQQ